MKVKFNGVSLYELGPKQAYCYTSAGGDVVTSEYRQPETAAGTVESLSYDIADNLMEGYFSLALKKVRNFENDTEDISFTNGAFKGTMIC